MNRRFLLALSLTLLAFAGAAETFRWTGAEDAYWTNDANWKVEKIGGGGEWVAASRCPGALLMDDEAAQWEAFASESDTAVFAGALTAPAGGIDLSGLLAISNVTFRGAGLPAVTFGLAGSAKGDQATDQRLPIHANGSVTLEADAGSAPVFRNGLAPWVGYAAKGDNITFRNDSATLALDLGTVIGYTRCGAAKTSWSPELRFEGAGNFQVPKFVAVVNSQNYTIFCAMKCLQEGTITVVGSMTIPSLVLGSADAPCGDLILSSTGDISFGDLSGGAYAYNDATIRGPGTLTMYGRATNVKFFRATYLRASSGKTLTVAPDHIASGNSSLTEWWLDDQVGGTVSFGANVTNAFTGSAYVNPNGILETPRIDAADGVSPIGTGDSVYLLDNATLAYSGAGETTARTIILTNAGAAVSATLDQRGSGVWTVSSFAHTATATTLQLWNGTAVDGVLSATLADGAGVLSLVKSGSGRWQITGALSYTGATTLEDGALAFGGNAKTLSSLVVTGDATVEVADGTVLTVSSVTCSAGSLDVKTSGTGAVKFPSLPAGRAPSWLTIDGKKAVVDTDGSVRENDHTWTTTLDIPAHGGVIPSAAATTDFVGVTTDGEGSSPITVADASGATVAAIVQKTDADATVSLQAGQTLTARMLAIEPDAGSLTIGADTATGAFAVNGSTLVLDNGSASSEISVRAPLAGSGLSVIKSGPGKATLPGIGTTWSGSAQLEEGTLALADTALAGQIELKAVQADEAPVVDLAVTATGLTLSGEGSGGSAIQLAGSNPTGTLAVTPNGGTFIVSGKETSLRVQTLTMPPEAEAATSVVQVVDGARVWVTNQVSLGALSNSTRGNMGRLVVSNATFASGLVRGTNPDSGATSWVYMNDALIVGNEYGPGVLEIGADAVMTNRLIVGYSRYSGTWPGTVSQRGGTVVWGYQPIIGVAGHGYYEMFGGTATIEDDFRIGGRNANAYYESSLGILALYGGTMTAKTSILLGCGTCPGVVFVKNATLALGQWNYLSYDAKGGGYVTIGEGGRISGINLYNLNNGTQLYPSVINVNDGGTLALQTIGFTGTHKGPTYLNVNGGTINQITENFDVSANRLTRATVYAQGLELLGSKASWNLKLYGPFRAPTGNVVASIPVPDALDDAGLIGAPFVEIVGDGTGATAFAHFDTRTGKVTSVEVTSGGWGYTHAQAKFLSGGSIELTTHATVDCVLAPATRGPLVYRAVATDRNLILYSYGSGLSFDASVSNEFSEVQVACGRLTVGDANAIAVDTGVALEADGTLILGDYPAKFAYLEANGGKMTGTSGASGKLEVEVAAPGGSISNLKSTSSSQNIAITATGAWNLDGATIAGRASSETYPVYGRSLTFAPGSTLTIANVDALTGDSYVLLKMEADSSSIGTPTVTSAPQLLTAGWRLVNVGGERLVLKRRRGVIFVIR